MLRLRSTWLAGGSALLLIVALTGLAAAAPLVSDTPQGFVDLDGNGIADQCEATVAADPITAALAFAAADTDGDGTISVTEAAHSGWVGGKNCNHGGYVSSVASGDDTCDAETPAADEGVADGSEASTPEVTTISTTAASATDCAAEPAEDPAEAPSDAEAPAPAVCPVTELVPPAADAPVDTAPNAHGKAVSDVAQSDAVGGKNCNHGGVVSEAAKKDHGAGPDAAKVNGKQAKSNGKNANHAHGKGHKTP
jgi:hypothetical protein